MRPVFNFLSVRAYLPRQNPNPRAADAFRGRPRGAIAVEAQQGVRERRPAAGGLGLLGDHVRFHRWAVRRGGEGRALHLLGVGAAGAVQGQCFLVLRSPAGREIRLAFDKTG